MKKIISVILLLLMLTTVYAENEITVDIDSVQVTFDTQPRIINARTMVPVRSIFEAIGAKVSWDGNTKTITAEKDSIKIAMTIGANLISKGDEFIVMDTSAMIIDNRTFIPARFAAEAFDNSVSWDSVQRAVHISTTLKPDIQYYKKYRNESMSIMYPSDWYLDESFPGMVFIDNQSDSYSELGIGMISVSQTEFFNSSFPDTVSAKYDYLISDCNVNISEFKNTVINGCHAALFKYTDAEGDYVTSYIIAGNEKAYFIEFISDKEGIFDNIYNTVLSTFTLL